MPDFRSGFRWDALWRPRGPLPASAYWLRRTVIALVVLALIVLVVLLAAGHGGGSHPSAGVSPSRTSAPATPSPGPSSTAPVSAGPGPSGSATAPAPTPAAAGPCTAAQVTLAVTTSARTYPGSSAPSFTATATATGASCVLSGPATFVVRSGSDRVWANTDCASAAAGDSHLLTAGKPDTVARSWQRVRSNPGCATVSGSKTAAAGTYRVTVSWGPATSAEAVFTLS